MNDNSKPRILRAFDLRFESIGHTDADLDGKEFTEMEAEGFTDTLRRENTLPRGVQRVVSGYISEDDAQGATNRKVFVSVTVRVLAADEDTASEFAAPADLLTRIADAMGTDEDGANQLELEGNWIVAETDPAEEP